MFGSKECAWIPPEVNKLQLCCDGASRGNPGRSGAGVVVRDSNANVLGSLSVGFGIRTNYLAELFCVIVALDWATKFEVGNVCIRTDSMGAVQAYNGDNMTVPCFLRHRWIAVKIKYQKIRFVHIYREVNFAADVMAKRGCLLENGEGIIYDSRSDFVRSFEFPNIIYFRFD